MKILIIGGTGNISTEVARLHVWRGDEVAVLNRGNSPAPDGCRQLTADCRDREAVRAAVEGETFEVVADYLSFVPEHVERRRDVFAGRIRQYIFISSAMVYQKPPPRLPVTEDAPRGNEFSEYARNKIACEEYLEGLAGVDFPWTIVRPSHTFGTRWIPSPGFGSADYTLAQRIVDGRAIIVHDDGQSLWTMTACADFALGFAGLVGNEAALGEAFHITSDEALTWNCIYQELGRALGAAPKIVYIPSAFLARESPGMEGNLQGDKANHAVFDNAKIKRFAPEFACQKPFRVALAESLAWYDADPARKTVNAETDEKVDALIENWRASNA